MYDGFIIGPNENGLSIHIDNEHICFMKDGEVSSIE